MTDRWILCQQNSAVVIGRKSPQQRIKLTISTSQSQRDLEACKFEASCHSLIYPTSHGLKAAGAQPQPGIAESRSSQINPALKRFRNANPSGHKYREHYSFQRTDCGKTPFYCSSKAHIASRLRLSTLHGHKPLLLVSGSTQDQGQRRTRPMAQLTSWSTWHSRYKKTCLFMSVCELIVVYRVRRIERSSSWNLKLKTWEAT